MGFRRLTITLLMFAGWPGSFEQSRGKPVEADQKSASVRVAAAQPESRLIDWRMPPVEALHQVDRTIEDFTEMVDRAGAAGCDLIVFPEDTLGLLHWEMGNREKLAEVLPIAVRRMKKRLGAAGRRNRLYVSCCSDTWEPDGAFRNTAFLLDRQGEEIGRYHKVHPAVHESDRKPGDSFPVFETSDLGGIGMLICYDMVMPESARSLSLGGADIILLPTLGGAVAAGAPDVITEDINIAAFRTRAVDNLVYLVVAKRGSGSMIISPQGRILARTEETDGIVFADIDPYSGREGGDALNSQKDMRARLFRERNPDAYHRLTEPHPAVLDKIPATIAPEEAARIGAATLTIGQELFQRAEELLKKGETEAGVRALEKLRHDFPDTWIDRAAKRLLETLDK